MHKGRTFVGVVLVVLGVVWTLQGLGVLPGSVMNGMTFWVIIGPIVSLFGLVVILSARHPGRPRS